MFRMVGFARAVVLAAVAGASAFGPSVADACSPAGLRVNLLAPNLRDPTATRAVFWFSLTGADYGTVDFDLAPEILGPDGLAAPVVVSAAVMSSRQDGPSSFERRVRVEATLEPNTAYLLTYNTPPPTPYGGEITRMTRAFMTGAAAGLDRPANPTVFLAFAAGEADERIPLPCTYDESYEVTVIMVSAPNARAIHARMRYADEAGFSHAITHVVPEGATGATLFAWAEERGLPCVEVVVEGADGSRTEPTVVCEAVGCVEGEEWSAAVGRSVEWWREEYGPGSCSGVESAASARGCACVTVAQAHSVVVSVIAGLMVVLVFLRRRSGAFVGALVS